ncbi:hypothetical protein RRG08_056635 [Elysia crispata]|uniref:Uncharacterized protein n=1 Tax=Elysia crispata TaxID=231223 RepID=A0AAE0YSW3_9GAST|nr:hypothetical protein RRG08_056635 [Elysia crispata]
MSKQRHNHNNSSNNNNNTSLKQQEKQRSSGERKAITEICRTTAVKGKDKSAQIMRCSPSVDLCSVGGLKQRLASRQSQADSGLSIVSKLFYETLARSPFHILVSLGPHTHRAGRQTSSTLGQCLSPAARLSVILRPPP